MRHVFLSVFAIALAGVAAIAATTAMLNAPVRTSTVAAIPVNGPAPATPPATAAPPASAPAPATPTDASKPAAPTPDGAKPAAGTAAPGKDTKEDEADEDPYAGIAPEELPPDLQYSADSSVSFPTNI
jgi:hypothetical protein